MRERGIVRDEVREGRGGGWKDLSDTEPWRIYSREENSKVAKQLFTVSTSVCIHFKDVCTHGRSFSGRKVCEVLVHPRSY